MRGQPHPHRPQAPLRASSRAWFLCGLLPHFGGWNSQAAQRNPGFYIPFTGFTALWPWCGQVNSSKPGGLDELAVAYSLLSFECQGRRLPHQDPGQPNRAGTATSAEGGPSAVHYFEPFWQDTRCAPDGSTGPCSNWKGTTVCPVSWARPGRSSRAPWRPPGNVVRVATRTRPTRSTAPTVAATGLPATVPTQAMVGKARAPRGRRRRGTKETGDPSRRGVARSLRGPVYKEARELAKATRRADPKAENPPRRPVPQEREPLEPHQRWRHPPWRPCRRRQVSRWCHCHVARPRPPATVPTRGSSRPSWSTCRSRT